MDTRKVTLIATIAAILLLAVGIGYAYTASTLNSGNTANSEYITMIQGTSGAYKFSDGDTIYWDAADMNNGGIKTVYTLSATPDTTTFSGNTVVGVGNSFILKTAPQAGATGTADLTCTITSSGFAGDSITGATGLPTFYLKVTPKQADNTTDGTPVLFKLVNTGTELAPVWTFKSGSGTTWAGGSTFTIKATTAATGYADAKVEVFYGYEGSAGVSVPHEAGTMPTAPTATPLTSGSLTFTVEKSGSN